MITGFAGFIGSNLTRYWLDKFPGDQVIGLDAMTYAARPQWVHDYLRSHPEATSRFSWVVCDLSNEERTNFVISAHNPDLVIHLAAESHVCRSIETPRKFLTSNVIGTYNLIDACRMAWKGQKNRIHVVSTDEVYGELSDDPADLFHEEHSYAPRSPYSASKAAADHFAMAFHHTFGMDITISNCSNNFGPNQDLEKLIPKTIHKLMNQEPVELYGTGKNIRDWLWVEDHCKAIDLIIHTGHSGQTYCVGGKKELTNQQVVERVFDAMKTLKPKTKLHIDYVDKRKTDDKRYGIDISKIQKELAFEPSRCFQENLVATCKWYLDNDQTPEEKLL